MSLTQLFQALSDETRLRVVLLLACEPELSVCELVHAMDLSQPKVSRHLAYLRDAGVVDVRRQAQWVFYRLSEDLEPWKRQVLADTLEGLRDNEELRQDRKRLQEMEHRPCQTDAA